MLAPLKIGANMRLFPRENYLKKIRGFYHDDGMIKVITGVRRCGKSMRTSLSSCWREGASSKVAIGAVYQGESR